MGTDRWTTGPNRSSRTDVAGHARGHGSLGHDGRQQAVAGTLATIAGLAVEKKLSPPVLTIIGDVVKLRGN